MVMIVIRMMIALTMVIEMMRMSMFKREYDGHSDD